MAVITLFTGRILPSRASSPTNSPDPMLSAVSDPPRSRIDRAIGKSKWVPSLGSSAGARLMTILPFGKSSSEFFIALLTRSFASSIALLPSPIICRFGSPADRSPSTSII